jgi:hypothetical protein
MPLRGEELGVRLANLWLCGRSYLPNIAAQIAQANGAVAGASADAPLFHRRAPVPDDLHPLLHDRARSLTTEPYTGIAYPHWDALRDQLQRVLADSAENMYATADTLIDVANVYAEEDTAAGDRMRTKIAEFEDGGAFVIDDPDSRPELLPPQ